MTENSIIESVVIGGDLSKLSPEQRVSYYKAVCTSLNLNPLTKPFSYITLNGKLTLYANKDAADQLRNLKNISIDKPEITFQDDWIIVTVCGSDGAGRKDSDVGVVNKKDMRGDFGNALMKAVTKAKRRLTLSICGLGMLDETEISSIPDARPVQVDIETGEVEHVKLRDTIYKPDNPIVNIPDNPIVNIPDNLLTTDDVDKATNSKGELLIDLQTDKLSYMANSLIKSLKDNGLTPMEKEARKQELKAITTIIEDRNRATE